MFHKLLKILDLTYSANFAAYSSSDKESSDRPDARMQCQRLIEEPRALLDRRNDETAAGAVRIAMGMA
jgi:hypothetical protein